MATVVIHAEPLLHPSDEIKVRVVKPTFGIVLSAMVNLHWSSIHLS